MSKWIKRWTIPSNSEPGKEYVVSLAADGTYGCSCPAWKFRRLECSHIQLVKVGGGTEGKEPPSIMLAVVREVTLQPETNTVLTPLIPIGNEHFQATVVYDLFRAGVPWSVIRERYDIAKINSLTTIKQYIEAHGRMIYGEPMTNYTKTICEVVR
jgi:hypothetical protein